MPVQGTSGCSARQLPGSKIMHFIQFSSKQGFAQQRLVDRDCACASCGAGMWHLGQLPKPLLQFGSRDQDVKQRLFTFHFITPSSSCRLPLGFGRCSTNIELKIFYGLSMQKQLAFIFGLLLFSACFYFRLTFIFSSNLAQVVLGNFWVRGMLRLFTEENTPKCNNILRIAPWDWFPNLSWGPNLLKKAGCSQLCNLLPAEICQSLSLLPVGVWWKMQHSIRKCN